MAVVSRVSRVRVGGSLNSHREFTATASVQDAPAGSTINVTVAQTTSGSAPPDEPNQNIELRFFLGAGATFIRTISIAPTSLPSTQQFSFTATGIAGAAARAGTIRMRIRVTKTNGGPLATYDVDSDGTNTTGAGGNPVEFDKGWIRGTLTAVCSISNVSAGGGKVQPAQFPESLYHRATLSSETYESVEFNHIIKDTNGGTVRRQKTSTGTATQRNVTFSGTSTTTGRVNAGFPANSSSYTADVAATGTSALTGLPDTVVTSSTTDTITVDPRLRAAHLFQLDDNAAQTPPLSGMENDNERPATSIGYLATGIYAARGSVVGSVMSGGVNGVTANFTLTAPNGDVVSRSATTELVGGEDGWTPGFLAWTSPLPGGTWNKLVNITGPADITGAAYLQNAASEYVLISSRNPFVNLIMDIGHADSTKNDRHTHNGDEVEISMFFKRTKAGERKLLQADPDPVPAVSIERVRGGNVEVYNGTEWVIADPDLHFIDMQQISDYVWSTSFMTDDNWGDFIINGAAYFEGVAYDSVNSREMVGNANHHDLDSSENVGIVTTVHDNTFTESKQEHLHTDGSCALEVIVVPRNSGGVDSNENKTTQLSIRRTGDNGSEDLADLTDPNSWIATSDPGHPNNGGFILLDASTDAVLSLPTGVAVYNVPADVVASCADVNAPWMILSALVTYDAGLVTERQVLETIQQPLTLGKNKHTKYEFDGAGFVGFPTR